MTRAAGLPMAAGMGAHPYVEGGGSGSTLGESGILSGGSGIDAMSAFTSSFANPAFTSGAKIFGKTIDQVGKTVKNKEGMKRTGGMFKALAGAAASFGLSMFIYLLEQLGILAPFFKVFGGLLKFLGGKILVALMPIISRFIAVLTSPEFLDYLSAIAELIAAMLVPSLEFWLMILEQMQPFLPILTDQFGLLAAEIMELIGILLEEEEIVLMIKAAVLVLITVLVFFIINIRIVVGALTSMFSAMKAWKKWIDDVQASINAATGGSGGKKKKKGSHGDVADWVIGQFAEGTDYVPTTGPYILHEGEKVTESGGDDQSAFLQEENNALLKDLIHYLRFGN